MAEQRVVQISTPVDPMSLYPRGVNSLLSADIQTVLELQGISSATYVGVLDCEAALPLLKQIAGEEAVVRFANIEEAVRAARANRHYVLVVGIGSVLPLLASLGAEASTMVAVIAVGDGSAAALRSAGAMALAHDVTEEALRPLIKRGLEFRALRALELAHRCELRRLIRREMDLLGYPPETMTDDLNTFQPPPLPVGPISTYNLEAVSESFERAYVDRVQLLCESAREAARYLDVSAATLARRLRREGTTNAE